MTRKPITEHLAELPEEYREEALAAYRTYPLTTDEFELQSDALLNGFPWIISSKPSQWKDLYNDLKSKGL